MSFIWPDILWLLIVVPIFVGLYLRLRWRRQRQLAGFGQLGLLPQQDRPGRRRHLPALLFLASLTILIVALARPQAVVNLPRNEVTVILAFDVSASMAADDLQPSRIEAAKVAAREFVEAQPANVQLGVVVFSDSGFMVQAPTNDHESVLSAIQRLTPQRGTSLAYGILMALNTIAAKPGQVTNYYSNATPAPTATPTAVPPGTYTPAIVILLTDGENNEPPDPLEAARLAADRGVRIFTIGLGSPAGAMLNIDGFTVLTQLNEVILREISQITSGAYSNAGNEAELQEIYASLDPQLVIKPEKMEISALFAGASLLMLLVGGALSMLWFNRVP